MSENNTPETVDPAIRELADEYNKREEQRLFRTGVAIGVAGVATGALTYVLVRRHRRNRKVHLAEVLEMHAPEQENPEN